MDVKQYTKLLVMTLYDMQELRKATDNRIDDFKRKGGEASQEMAKELKTLVANSLHKLENEMESRVAVAVSKMPIIIWLEKVYGIGPRYSGSLVATIQDIARFPRISSLWAYCGMGLVPVCMECEKIAFRGRERIRFCMNQADRRWRIYTSSKKYQDDEAKGKAKDEETYKIEMYDKTEKQLCQHEEGQFETEMRAPQRRYFKSLLLTHNPFAKMTCWKIAGQFVRQGKFYRLIYEQAKAKYVERDSGKLSDGHIDLRARRATVKLFLSHLWEMWRKSIGLPAGKPWLMEQQGMDFETHKYIPPPYVGTYDPEDEKEDIAAD